MSLSIFHLDDDIQILEKFEKIFQSGLDSQPVTLKGFESAGELEKALSSKPHVDIFILDVFLGAGTDEGTKIAANCRIKYPKSLIFMCSNAKDLKTIRSSLKVGADDFIAKDSKPAEIIERVASALKQQKISDAPSVDSPNFHAGRTLSGVKTRIPQIINSAVNCIYILGESGTGKEVVANLLESSLPKGTPFIKVNCGSIAPTLLASELFGHTKGSFTGANHDKAGLIEAANKGWIFLDEVATLPPDAQVSLLRAIDNQSIRRIGSNGERPVSFRVISATNESLSDLVDQGKFRRDLWQRLREVQIDLPPLRERREEIPELVNHFCHSMRGGPYQLAPNVLNILTSYSWKEGNIRELRNCLRAMTEKSANKILTPNSVPEHIWDAVEAGSPKFNLDQSVQRTSENSSIIIKWRGKFRPSFEELSSNLLLEIIRQEYERSGQMSMRSAAKALGIAKSSLPGKIRLLLECGLISMDELGKMIHHFDETKKSG